MSLSEYPVIKKEFQWKQIRFQHFMSNIEYSVITSAVIKSFDCSFLWNRIGPYDRAVHGTGTSVKEKYQKLSICLHTSPLCL